VVELAESFFNIPTTFFITAKSEKSSQQTFSQATLATTALVSKAIKFTFDLKKRKNVVDLRVIVLEVDLFPGSFLRGITDFRNFESRHEFNQSWGR
jgi:hypothetical protein